jgi:HEAT repeat protein
LNRLRALGDAWARAFDARHDDPVVIRAFVASRDPLELPGVLKLAFSRDTAVRDAATEAIDEYLGRLSPRDLVALDHSLRRAIHWRVTPGEAIWGWLRPPDISLLAGLGTRSASVLGLASFHPSGYVREAAVRELAKLTDGGELRFLLTRLNDWVGVVQDRAYHAVRDRLTPDYAPYIVRLLWLLARLEGGARTAHAALAQEATALLSGPEWRPALREALDTPDRWLRRMGYRLLLETPAGDMTQVVGKALRDGDTVVRLRAAERVESVLPEGEILAVIPLLQRDPFMPVRREALRLLVRYNAAAGPELRRALLDRHATIREVARYELRRRGIRDFREFYSGVLEDPERTDPEVRSALYGLGETGTVEDANLAERFLAHRVPGIRKAAVTALVRLTPDAPVSIFMRGLEDSSAGVSKAARQALGSRPGGMDGGLLWEIFQRNPEAHVRNNALSLLAGLGKWESIGWVIRACGAEEDELIMLMARQHLRRWIDRFNRNQTRPTKDQLERMAQALDSRVAEFDRDTERMLRFLMKGY